MKYDIPPLMVYFDRNFIPFVLYLLVMEHCWLFSGMKWWRLGMHMCNRYGTHQ